MHLEDTSISKFPTWISRFSWFKNNLLNSYTSVITGNSAKIVEMKLTVQTNLLFKFLLSRG